MIYFLLAVIFTVALYLIMRAYPGLGIDSFHAIVINYYACVLTGLVLTPDWRQQLGQVDWMAAGTLWTLALGSLFVVVFLLIGQTTQKVGVTAASLAGNLSLVIPVLFGLWVFQNNNKVFTGANYAGLLLAFAALGLGAWRSGNGGAAGGFRKEVLIWPALYFLGSGTNNTLINYLSAEYYLPGEDTLFMIIACIGAAVVGTLLLVFRLVKRNERLSPKSAAGGLLLGIPNFLSLYFLLRALATYGNSAAFVFPVYQILTMLVAALAAWLLYREKLSAINKLGLFLAVLAILLLSYQELGWG